ncbi:hypothetical protein [Microcoleus sp. herbarium12]
MEISSMMGRAIGQAVEKILVTYLYTISSIGIEIAQQIIEQ